MLAAVHNCYRSTVLDFQSKTMNCTPVSRTLKKSQEVNSLGKRKKKKKVLYRLFRLSYHVLRHIRQQPPKLHPARENTGIIHVPLFTCTRQFRLKVIITALYNKSESVLERFPA